MTAPRQRRAGWIQSASAAVLLMSCLPAWAHVDGAAGVGFFSGLAHPVLGWDHLLAMVCVGLWGAILGRPLVVLLPVAFPVLMLGGAALGMAGVPLPRVEAGIAASVLGLGLAVSLAWRAPVPAALALVAVFGVVHGHAHGTELPDAADPAAYAAGFLLATGLLHLAGVAIGSLWHTRAGSLVIRGLGSVIAGTGLWLLARQLLAV